MNNETTGIIYGINGPVIYIEGKTSFRMGEMVYVGKQRLVGEVIRLDDKRTTIQVYEETSGLKPGEEVISTGAAISVTLAPGILDNIFDGIERPLHEIAKKKWCLYQPRCQRGFPGHREEMENPYDRKRRAAYLRRHHYS